MSDVIDHRPWSSREVHFTAFPNTPSESLDRLLDALADEFYGGRIGRRVCASVSRCERTFEVGVLSWWLPGWVARRWIVIIASRVGVGGDAHFVVKRCVL